VYQEEDLAHETIVREGLLVGMIDRSRLLMNILSIRSALCQPWSACLPHDHHVSAELVLQRNANLTQHRSQVYWVLALSAHYSTSIINVGRHRLISAVTTRTEKEEHKDYCW